MTTRVAPQEYQKVSFTKTITFTAGNIDVTFIPETGIPGYSHRIIITQDGQLIGKDWMDKEYSPTHKTAEFFYNKLVNGVYKS